MSTGDQEAGDNQSSLRLDFLGSSQKRPARKRKGRGNASGNGRTAGKGEKGQTSRAGASIPSWFEGGALPLYRKIPKFGFRSRKRVLGLNQYMLISLSVLDSFDDGSTVDAVALAERGYKPGAKQKAGIKVLANGELSKKLTVKVAAVTKSAQEQIEKAGGSVEIVKTEVTEKENSAD